MKVDFNRKYTTVAVYTVLTFAVCLLLVVIVQKSEVISGYIKSFAKVIAPITWGIVFAYIMNPIMMWTEKLLKKLFAKKGKAPLKFIRAVSVFFSLIMLLAVIIAIVAILLPQILESVMGIAGNASIYLANFETWIYKFVEDYPDISNAVTEQFNNIQPKITDFMNNLLPWLADMAVKLKDGAAVFVIGLKDFIIGFIVSIYLLSSKELFIAQMKKIVTAVFPDKMSDSVLSVAAHANRTLSGFISGKLIDSAIIGAITFICMTIMEMDFVALISVVIGVTNIIPFFGPIIGAVPSALLLLMAAPKQVIPFIIFIIILQQFDGNILGPKILGDSTGLSAFWVMFAIFVGGGLFGFAGMLLGVPVFAVIYSLVSDFVNFLLKRKGLSTNTLDYFSREEPESSEKVKRQNKAKKPAYFEKFLKINNEKKDEAGGSSNDDGGSGSGEK